MLGSELVVQALKRRGVSTIFSLSGNQIMPLYDACIDAGLRIVHVRHEAAAVFMADSWSQVTGETGVALLTAGPGIANAVGAMFSALQSESPVLVLSGDSSLSEDGTGAFQEMDQAGMTAPVSKHARRVTSATALAAAVDEAMDLANAGRSGPVHLALPFDLLSNESGIAQLPPMPAAAPASLPSRESLAAIEKLTATARRPVLLVGPSQSRRHRRAGWEERARALQLPLIPMESPRGLRDPSLGTVADRIAEADLVILAGKRIDFTLGFGKGASFAADARVVMIDSDPAMLARAQRLLGSRLAASCEAPAEALFDSFAPLAGAVPGREEWIANVQQSMRNRALSGAADAGGKLGSREVCEAVQTFIAGLKNPIVVCDGGEFGQWAQAFCQAPVRVINGPSGAIGGGICYAIAASIARPDATVVALMGDGTAGFHLPEFDTAVREQARFIAVIGNDLRWNAEHMIQLRTYGPDRLIGCNLAPSAAYDEAVRGLGGFGAAASDKPGLQAALGSALASGLPACINVAIKGEAAPVFAKAQAGAGAH